MGWHVKTRSRNKDYLFIGGSPERWWARFGRDTSFERPSLLVERSGDRPWRLLASGIRSVRKDVTQTQLRYTVVATGEPGRDTEMVGRLVAAWLTEAHEMLGGSETQGPLSRALDDTFDEATIEEWFAQDPGAREIGEQAERRLLDALERLPGPVSASSIDTEEVDEAPDESRLRGTTGWYGSLHSAASREAFVRLTDDLINGRVEGAAYLLNLVERPEEIRVEIETGASGVLFDVPETKLAAPTPLARVPRRDAKKKDLAAAPSTPPPGTARAPHSKASTTPPDHPAEGRADGAGPDPGVAGAVDADEVTSVDEEAGEPGSSATSGSVDVPSPDRGAATAVDAAHETEAGRGDEPLHSSLLRRALPGRDVVRKVRDAGRDTLEEVLGTSRETLEEALVARFGTLEEVLGAGRQTLEAFRKEVTAAAREGAARGAREVLEAVISSTRAISGRTEDELSPPPQPEGHDDEPTGIEAQKERPPDGEEEP